MIAPRKDSDQSNNFRLD